MTKEQMIQEMEELETRLRKLRKEITMMPMDEKPISTASGVEDVKTMSLGIDRVVMYNLHELGIPSNLDGYKYLKTTIKLLIEGKVSSNYSVTKELYPAVAKLHGKTSQQVERAIRHAIEVACERGDLKFWEALFRYSTSCKKGRPTNSEFIATLVEHINNFT